MKNIGVLPRLYFDMVGKQFNVDEKEDRIILQKIVFFLEEMGVNVGGYCFVLETHGPFSQSLSNDIHEKLPSATSFTGIFSKPVQDTISFLKETLFSSHSNDSQYTLREWLEAVASFMFLRTYSYPSKSWGDIERIMIEKYNKDHLKCSEENQKAIECCTKLSNYSISL